MKGGNNRMMYIGAMDQYYTWTMFDAQAKWAVQYIMGKIKLPEREAMMDEIKKWTKRWVDFVSWGTYWYACDSNFQGEGPEGLPRAD